MRIIARSTLNRFWEEYRDGENGLKAWCLEVRKEVWNTPGDAKRKYGNASFIANNRVIFNICGNKYRLLCWIKYDKKEVYVKFIGTHKQYDMIKAETYDGEYFKSNKKRKRP